MPNHRVQDDISSPEMNPETSQIEIQEIWDRISAISRRTFRFGFSRIDDDDDESKPIPEELKSDREITLRFQVSSIPGVLTVRCAAISLKDDIVIQVEIGAQFTWDDEVEYPQDQAVRFAEHRGIPYVIPYVRAAFEELQLRAELPVEFPLDSYEIVSLIPANDD